MDERYQALMESIIAETPDYTARDFIPVRYRYGSEPLSTVQAEQLLRLTGGGRTDAAVPISLTLRPSEGLFILSTIAGGGKLTFSSPAKTTLSLEKGSLLLFDRSAASRWRSVRHPWSFRLFFLEGPGLRQYLPLLKPFCLADASASPAMACAVETLGSFPADVDLPSLFSMHRTLTDLLSDACISALSPDGDAACREKLPVYLRDLHRYIHDCANLVFSLSDLEELYGVSRYRLCREYRAAFHIPPLKDFNHVRILEAKKLLLNTTLQVQEISSRLGYENANHFIHLFKAETGMTPGAFRSARENP